MARGWESKNIESQMEEARQPQEKRREMTPDERARVQEIEALRLSRRRVLQELERATAERHRAMLEKALDDLDQKIKSRQG